MEVKQKITPFLWFDGKAEEAINFFVSIFKNSKIGSVNRIGKEGALMTATFQIEGQQFMVLNGGPMFSFTPAISLFVSCETQEEVDKLWERLSEGGQKKQCGWLQDKFGLSWQIIPTVLGRLLHGGEAEKSKRVMEAMLKMTKIDIALLEQA